MMGDELRVLVVGQIPPPLHGQSLQIQRLVDHRFKGIRVDLIPMRFSRSVDDIGQPRPAKLLTLLALIRDIRRYARRNPGATLYFPPAPGSATPILRDVLLVPSIRRRFRAMVVALHAAGQRSVFGRNRFLHLLSIAVYGRPKMAILNSADAVPDAEALNAREIRVIPIGIPDPGEPRPREWEDRTIRILSVGHISREKGSFDLLEAFALLIGRGMDLQLRFVGPFAQRRLRTELVSRGRALGVTDRLELSGTLAGDALAEAYRGADLFAFPTRVPSESLGLVAVEAMAHGLPVVASDWRGIAHVVEAGRTGLLHAPGDAADIARALERLIVDHALRRRLGRAGRERFLSTFHEDRYWAELTAALLAATTEEPFQGA